MKIKSFKPLQNSFIAGAVKKYPEWVNWEMGLTYERFKKCNRSNNAIVFPVITDLHSIFNDKNTAEPGLRNSMNHIRYIHGIAEKFNCDFIADLGDIGLELPETSSREAAKRLVEQYAGIQAESQLPTLQCMGNHDHNRGSISNAEFGDAFNKKCAKRGHKIIFGKNASYGYYDVPNKKCRVFFLNTSDNIYYGFSEEQLRFFDENTSLDSTWTVIVLTHLCVDPIGRWLNDEPLSDTLFDQASMFAFLEIIKRNKNITGVFAGDSHFDHFIKRDDINFFITQGYGGVDLKKMPAGAQFNFFDTMTNMLVDLVVIEPVKREIKLLRLGAGGENCDRCSTF